MLACTGSFVLKAKLKMLDVGWEERVIVTNSSYDVNFPRVSIER